ncbi:MAG TPA: PEP/pyruvate-binding domain-containing protein [Candidatus Polarisedimenticolaceae bacterium]|nr:PEP/pyruvate-binding domain-containing protein [Candidatus Polarisedimenticolaceae bacterium]
MGRGFFDRREVPRFDRAFFRSRDAVMRIGDGELGGKARGLVLVRDLLAAEREAVGGGEIEIYLPTMAVLATDVFDAFIARNGLVELACSERSDEQIAAAFLRADLPVEVAGDLRALVEEVREPLAIRSSSLLEDALFRPFAGVYATKMVPNNQPDPDIRFRRLAEAIKFVFASTWFRGAREYHRAAGRAGDDEKMAVVIQEVVGSGHVDRFYPNVSGVGRSYNFFPSSGAAPEDGVVNLALGLGKTIVDGGVSWIYSPARPHAPAPFASVGDRMRQTQLEFWAVNVGPPPAYHPTEETEFLVKLDLAAADYDDTLSPIASTYDVTRDRLVAGTAIDGPRVVDFAPMLTDPGARYNDVIRTLLALGRDLLGQAVELEFAIKLARRASAEPARFGVLQLRPMLVAEAEIDITDDELSSPRLLLASKRVMGNGSIDSIRDVVYVRPDRFEARWSRQVAAQLERINRTLIDQSRPYLLIGFGRWGSSDPWLGVPVDWSQVSGARVIVESSLAGMDVEPSQGAHFFHNLISFEVCYLCVRQVDWEWLERFHPVGETELLRHVRLDQPLTVKVDGRRGRGGVWHR